MNSEQEPRELLTRAFHGFEKAATNLEQGHSALLNESRRLERELLDAHRRLEAVLDALDTGVAVLSSRGRILRANRAFRAMGLGGAKEGQLDADLGLPARGGAARVRRRASRGDRDLALTVRPVGDTEGTRVLTVQDITEIRRQEAEGGRRQRLEALGRMAAELAHEVRNPLGSIRLFAGMLKAELTDRSPREMAGQILRASSSLESIVANLLAFASPSRTEKRRTDLRALASEACELLAPACGARGVRLQGPRSATACPVWADTEAWRQVLLNLVGNALAATGSGGSIRVDVAVEKNRARLLVEDTGKGIVAEDLPRVFDPFFSRAEGGTGLGLSIVHGIVERHDGTISLDSSPGRGTHVKIEIPVGPSGKELHD